MVFLFIFFLAQIFLAFIDSSSEPYTSIYKYIQIYTRYFVFVAPKFSLLLPPLVIGFYQFIEAGRSQIRPFIRYSSPTNSPEMDSNLKNTKNTERNKLQTKNKAETMTCSYTKYHGQTYSNLNDVSILQLHSHIVLFWIHVSTTLFKVKYSLVGGLRSDCLAGQNTNN